MENGITGVILAGGLNRRFGGITKSHIEIDGVRIIDRIIQVFEQLFPEIIIVTNTPEEFEEFSSYKITQDQFKNTGPLGGIHAALKISSNEAVFVIAGDMPFPDQAIIGLQIQAFNAGDVDAIIPRIGSYIEPTHAIYSKSLLDVLEKYLAAGNSCAVRDFLVKRKVFYLPLPDTSENRKAFTNINSPGDLSGKVG